MIKNRFDTINDIDNPGKILEIKVDRLVRNTTGQVRNYIPINEDLKNIAFELLDSGLDADYISKNIDVLLMKRGVKMMENKVVKVEENAKVITLGIDIGNENVKVVYNDKVFSFENKVNRVNDEEECKQNDYIKFEDEVQYFTIADTEAKFDNSLYKDEREGNLKVIYYSIVKAFKEAGEEVPDKIKANLRVLTPINQVRRIELYKNNILKKASAMTTIRINGEEFINEIEIADVEIIAEGISSLKMVSERQDINLAKEQVVLLDCGSKTVNAVKVLKGNKLVDYKTYDGEGLNDIYYNQLCQKYNFTLDQIKTQIEIGQAHHDKKLLLKYFTDIYNKVQRDMKYNTCNHIIFTGGTIQLMNEKKLTEEFIRKTFNTEKVVFLENPSFTNVLGLK